MQTISQLINKTIRALEHMDSTTTLVLVCCVVAVGVVCMRGFGSSLR